MKDLGRLIWSVLLVLFRSRAALAAEYLVLRQQINVLRRTVPKRPLFNSFDRLVFVGLSWLFFGVRDALAIVKPDTVIRFTVADSGSTGADGRGRKVDGPRCRLRSVG